MSLRAKIFECLRADATVTGVIGNGDACRYFAGRAPQEVAAPFVVSAEITSDAQETHGNEDDAEDVCDESLIQFSCYAETLAAALALRQAVRSALINDEQGILASERITVTAPRTREVDEQDVNLFCAELDLTFFHNPNT